MVERWMQYYDEHLNGTENKYMTIQGSARNGYVGMFDNLSQPASTFREVKEAIHQLKNNKSAGNDGIGAKRIVITVASIFGRKLNDEFPNKSKLRKSLQK